MTTDNTEPTEKGVVKDNTATQDKQITNVKDLHTERIDIMIELLLTNYTRGQIIQYCNTVLLWNLSPRQIDNYISDARQAQRTFYKSTLPTLLEDTAAQYDLLYKRAVKSGDIRAAAKINQMKYEMINGKPIQATINKEVNDEQRLTTIMNGKVISLKIDKKPYIKELPEPDNTGA